MAQTHSEFDKENLSFPPDDIAEKSNIQIVLQSTDNEKILDNHKLFF